MAKSWKLILNVPNVQTISLLCQCVMECRKDAARLVAMCSVPPSRQGVRVCL